MEIKLVKSALFLGVVLTMLCFSCNKSNPDAASVKLPVVEAYLTPGKPVTVTISQQKALTDTTTYGSAITGLKVYVSDGTTSVLLTESKAGTYTYADQSFLSTGKTYYLKFNYLTYAVSAQTVMPAKPANFVTEYDTVTFTAASGPSGISTINRLSWSNPNSLNFVLAFDCTSGSGFPVSSFSENSNVSFEENTNALSYYNVTQNTIPFYGNYIVTLFSVDQEYINLLKSNTNNSNSQNLSNVATNIVNGFGIFTAVQADSLQMTFNQ